MYAGLRSQTEARRLHAEWFFVEVPIFSTEAHLEVCPDHVDLGAQGSFPLKIEMQDFERRVCLPRRERALVYHSMFAAIGHNNISGSYGTTEPVAHGR